jgi:hypothetical protein
MATAKQLAARARFAEMARSGAFKKTAKKAARKSNPLDKWQLYYKIGTKGAWKKSSLTTKTPNLSMSEISQYENMFAESNQVFPSMISLKMVSSSGAVKYLNNPYDENPARKSTRKSNPYLGEQKARIYSEQRDELEYFVQEKWSLGWHTVAGFTSLEMAKMFGEGMSRRTGKTYRVVIPE